MDKETLFMVEKKKEETGTSVIPSFGKNESEGNSAPPVASFEVLPRYQPHVRERNEDLCIVLHGYGIEDPEKVTFVDDYRFVGGVGRDIPRSIAQAWKTGKRWQDGKPAASRIYPQAILPNDATDVDFASATGVTPMEPAKLAAMIGATDAELLVGAMGRQQAIMLAEKLMKQAGKV